MFLFILLEYSDSKSGKRRFLYAFLSVRSLTHHRNLQRQLLWAPAPEEEQILRSMSPSLVSIYVFLGGSCERSCGCPVHEMGPIVNTLCVYTGKADGLRALIHVVLPSQLQCRHACSQSHRVIAEVGTRKTHFLLFFSSYFHFISTVRMRIDITFPY